MIILIGIQFLRRHFNLRKIWTTRTVSKSAANFIDEIFSIVAFFIPISQKSRMIKIL